MTLAEAGINIVGLVYDRALKLLMAAAAFVMLIVCANVANLLLVRALAQSQQTSVRMALGASREQLLQQAMISSIVASLCSAAWGRSGWRTCSPAPVLALAISRGGLRAC